MKIDIFPHIVPLRFYQQAEKILAAKRSFSPPCLSDLDMRFRIMDQFGDYMQVLTLPVSAIDSLTEGPAAKELARLVNDSMAELVVKYPDRFLGFAAAVPLIGTDAAHEEVDRSVCQLGALGVEIGTNVNGIPMDDPRFESFYAKMEALGKPIWVHPTRTRAMADYSTESYSKYGLSTTFGWPYETAIFMSRLIFSGVMDRYPNLRIITHHAGGIVPHLASRIAAQAKMPGPEGYPSSQTLKKDISEYYKMFYGDTALQGLAKDALRCAISFFGVDHVLFGTDMPFGEGDGLVFIRDTISTLDRTLLTETERRKVFEENCLRVLGLKPNRVA